MTPLSLVRELGEQYGNSSPQRKWGLVYSQNFLKHKIARRNFYLLNVAKFSFREQERIWKICLDYLYEFQRIFYTLCALTHIAQLTLSLSHS